ncbi:MAG: DMT family transporter [Tannerellaceae bacterium]|jgi:drug/metabolite transporter (DMT)-like permease|nr:DMT family transporter [Tannerellaceae bacterium]
MRGTFVKLHLSIILAGFTGILGKLISLNEALLVWYRILFALPLLWLLAGRPRIPVPCALRMMGVGALLALHWVFFFGSIKASNVSISVATFSMTGFFTAIFEPVVNRRRVNIRELMFGMIAVAGIFLIFHFDFRYRAGILLGVVSSWLAAMFSITNKLVGKSYPVRGILLCEMAGGFAITSLILPPYLHIFPSASILPSRPDLMWLLVFSIVCTVALYLLQIDVLKKISAFTLNLSYNLEPVYSIILAMIIFGESRQLGWVFYAGVGLIAASVLAQGFTEWKRAGGGKRSR